MAWKVEGEEISDWFWSIAERASKDPQKLRQLLWELSEEEVCRFHREFRLAESVLTGEPFDVIICSESDESEDGIMDIAGWVVSQGRGLYESILENPDAIPRHVDGGDPSMLGPVIGRVFRAKFGKSIASVELAWP